MAVVCIQIQVEPPDGRTHSTMPTLAEELVEALDNFLRSSVNFCSSPSPSLYCKQTGWQIHSRAGDLKGFGLRPDPAHMPRSKGSSQARPATAAGCGAYRLRKKSAET